MLKNVSKGVKRFWASLALLSLEMITILSIFFVSLIGFVFIVRNVFLLKNEELDHKVFDWVQPLVNDSTTSFMNVVTFFWQT